MDGIVDRESCGEASDGDCLMDLAEDEVFPRGGPISVFKDFDDPKVDSGDSVHGWEGPSEVGAESLFLGSASEVDLETRCERLFGVTKLLVMVGAVRRVRDGLRGE